MTELEELKNKLADIISLCEESLSEDIHLDFPRWNSYMVNVSRLSGTKGFQWGEEYGQHMLASVILGKLEEPDAQVTAAINNSIEDGPETEIGCNPSSGFS